MTIYMSIFVALILFHIIDGVSTYIIASSGGVPDSEWVGKMVEEIGLIPVLVGGKLFGIALAVFLYSLFPNVLAMGIAVVLLGLMVVASIRNICVIWDKYANNPTLPQGNS